ncbi:unnamed protein product [Rotaria sordida]|uniref:mannitol 2-dehydrogenase n=1 Tax=Rotaria sordida TaxID=392033 RepID=A0A815M4H1_9BILA|nr:unnamed protein product [Rotaria sordida]
MVNDEIPTLTGPLEGSTTENNSEQHDRSRGKITGQQIRTVIVSSTGFFMDAYDIFVINLAVPMLGYVYYMDQNNTVPSNIQGIIKGITNVGNLIGQLVFGYLSDSKGRKSVYGIELLIIIMATVCSAMAGSAATGVGTLGFLGFWRLVLGIGIGGDYPMSATVSSEWSSAGRRGQMLALTFSMQGWVMAADNALARLIVDKFKCDSVHTHLPTYNRSQLKHGIVHLSVGNFHRSHLAYYMDVLANEHDQTEWGIIGVGVRSVDKPISTVLQAQDGMYTLISKGCNETDVDVRIIGSLIRYIFAPDAPEGALAVLMHPHTKIVSMTITVSGYDLDLKNVDIQHDLHHPQAPRTVFGFIVHALDGRRRANTAPFTVLSCDNVQQNGEVIKRCILKFAKALNNIELLDYIQTKVTFPNSMVDRITPATSDTDRQYVHLHCGIADGWPVVTEPFMQWVIEDSFCNGHPPLELLSNAPYNVLLTEHVEAYECMKMRLLNASHTAMCYLGYLMGYTYIHETILDKHIQSYIEHLMNDEVTPVLPAVPNVDLDAYKRTLIQRFSNPHMKDTLSRVCMDGASKFPKYLVPTIVEQLKRGVIPYMCALAIGSWIRYLGGKDESNRPIILSDVLATELKLHELASETRPSAIEMLSVRQVFGDLANDQRFAETVQNAVKLLYEEGSKATLEKWISGPRSSHK